jgi:type 9 secretion system plug protein
MRTGLGQTSVLLLLTIGLACASAEETGRREPRGGVPDNALRAGSRVALPDSSVRTVQLFLTGKESALPILPMRQEQTLTLAFDLMGNDPRLLSAYFYHADRTWRRDLVPAEYLSSFQRDDLLDYGSSRATQLDYVHYRYVFPNDGIRFRLSGNYIIRITEQGSEEEIILERPFFVSEQEAALDLGIDPVAIIGSPYPSAQPIVSFTPPDPTGTVFDYSVCFLRNGMAVSERCSDRPRLDAQPTLSFYLEPEESFLAQPAEYWLDLSNLRIGGRIERTDLSRRPYEIVLEPDYFRFPGTAIAPLQNGQIVVDQVVSSVVDPGSAAEYVRVHFALVPGADRPVSGRVKVVGPFNNWGASVGGDMTWNPEVGRYEAVLLLKQGAYEYRYAFSDSGVERASMGASPRFDNIITAFVYRNDVHVGSDRLVSAVSVVTN